MKIVIFNDDRFGIRKGNWLTGYKFLVKNTFSARKLAWVWVGIRHPLMLHAYWHNHDSAFRTLQEYVDSITPLPKQKTDFGRPYKYRVY